MKHPDVQGITRRAARAWFALTPAEHDAVLLVAALFLLGLAVWAWRARNPEPAETGISLLSQPAARYHTKSKTKQGTE